MKSSSHANTLEIMAMWEDSTPKYPSERAVLFIFLNNTTFLLFLFSLCSSEFLVALEPGWPGAHRDLPVSASRCWDQRHHYHAGTLSHSSSLSMGINLCEHTWIFSRISRFNKAEDLRVLQNADPIISYLCFDHSTKNRL